MAVSDRRPLVSGRAGIGTRRIRLVWHRSRFLLVLLDLVHGCDLLVVDRGSGPLAPHLVVGHLPGVDQGNVFRILVMGVGEILVVVARIGEVGQVADWRVLVDLVAGRLVGGGLSGDLVRGRRTRS